MPAGVGVLGFDQVREQRQRGHEGAVDLVSETRILDGDRRLAAEHEEVVLIGRIERAVHAVEHEDHAMHATMQHHRGGDAVGVRVAAAVVHREGGFALGPAHRRPPRANAIGDRRHEWRGSVTDAGADVDRGRDLDVAVHAPQ